MMVIGTLPLLFAGIVATILAVLGALWVYASSSTATTTTTTALGVTTSSVAYVVLCTLAAVLCSVLVVISAVKLFAASLYEEAPTPAKPAPKRAPKPAKPTPKSAHKPAPNPTLTWKQERDRNLKAMLKEMEIARRKEAKSTAQIELEQQRREDDRVRKQNNILVRGIQKSGVRVPAARVGMMERVRNLFGGKKPIDPRFSQLSQGEENKFGKLTADYNML